LFAGFKFLGAWAKHSSGAETGLGNRVKRRKLRGMVDSNA